MSSNKFDSAHLTNSDIRVKKNSCQLKKIIHEHSQLIVKTKKINIFNTLQQWCYL